MILASIQYLGSAACHGPSTNPGGGGGGEHRALGKRRLVAAEVRAEIPLRDPHGNGVVLSPPYDREMNVG